MDALAFIFARGGSKGLPGKNTRLLAGKPLIGWAIEHARAVRRIRRVIVSTDSSEIAAVAREFGAEAPFLRPAELATDQSSEWMAWRHALEFIRNEEGRLPDAMVSVPATAPMRLPVDIENCLDTYAAGGADIVVTVTQAHRSPYFNMVKPAADGRVELVIPPQASVTRRQDAPSVFDMTTVAYVANPEFVLSQSAVFSGRVKAVEVPLERSCDIDTLFDFEFAEWLMQKRKDCAAN